MNGWVTGVQTQLVNNFLSRMKIGLLLALLRLSHGKQQSYLSNFQQLVWRDGIWSWAQSIGPGRDKLLTSSSTSLIGVEPVDRAKEKELQIFLYVIRLKDFRLLSQSFFVDNSPSTNFNIIFCLSFQALFSASLVGCMISENLCLKRQHERQEGGGGIRESFIYKPATSDLTFFSFF